MSVAGAKIDPQPILLRGDNRKIGLAILVEIADLRSYERIYNSDGIVEILIRAIAISKKNVTLVNRDDHEILVSIRVEVTRNNHINFVEPGYRR